MIEFRGNVGSEVKKFLLKRLYFGMLVSSMLFLCVLGIPSLIYGLVSNNYIALCIVIFSILLGDCLAFINLPYMVPNNIFISEKLITGKYKEVEKSAEASKVKKVIDYGNFYDFRFFEGAKWGDCICQKDLLVEGSIEEFEELFKDKLVRKK